MTRRTIPDPLRIAQTASAGVGTWADRAAAYSQWLPGYPQSARSYMELPPELRGYIKDRAAAYGMDPVEVFRKVPRALSEDPDAVESFLRGHEISHVYPTSTHPELEADPANWTFEVGEINGSRQATVMTPEEWHEAQESAQVWAVDFTGDQSWWDLNSIWKDFLEASKAFGYAGAWIPKSLWLEMMQSLRKLWNDLRAACSFRERMTIARNYSNQVFKGIVKWKNHIAAAFMLGLLCCMFPPATLFLEIWGLTSVASIALSLLRSGLIKGQPKFRWLRLFKFLNRPLTTVQKMVSAIADLLTKVKELIINGTAKVCDVIFTSGKMAWTKVVMPKVQAIVRKTKNVFAGFINWASNLYNCGNDGQSLSYA